MPRVIRRPVHAGTWYETGMQRQLEVLSPTLLYLAKLPSAEPVLSSSLQQWLDAADAGSKHARAIISPYVNIHILLQLKCKNQYYLQSQLCVAYLQPCRTALLWACHGLCLQTYSASTSVGSANSTQSQLEKDVKSVAPQLTLLGL